MLAHNPFRHDEYHRFPDCENLAVDNWDVQMLMAGYGQLYSFLADSQDSGQS